MKGYAKRTMYVSNWCESTKIVRGKAISDNTGMQLVEGNLYTIPYGREDLDRHFDLVTPRTKPVVEPEPVEPARPRKRKVKAKRKRG